MSIIIENTTPTSLISGSETITFDEVDGATKGQYSVTFDGAGDPITTGAKKAYKTVPYDGTITAVRLIGGQSGDIVVDVWKAAFPAIPTVANTITASAKPTLSSAQTYEDTTLIGWTKTVTKGDILEVKVDSVGGTLTKCELEIDIAKTGG